MKLHYFITPFSVVETIVTAADTKVIHHVKDVLKISVGEKIVLADGAGNKALVRIAKMGKDFLEGQLLEREVVLPLTPTVVLYAALLKRDMFELVVQKAVELGVTKIVPLITERTVKLGLNTERLERIIIEAVEQSEQSIVPELSRPLTLAAALTEAQSSSCYFFQQEGTKIAEVVPPKEKPIALFIGPEGGFAPEELQQAQSSGCTLVSLGPTMLRAETAAITTIFWVRNLAQ